MGQGFGVAMSCDTGHRQGSDPVLLWLRRRQAAVAWIQPLARELPCAAGIALKKKSANVSDDQYTIFV